MVDRICGGGHCETVLMPLASSKPMLPEVVKFVIVDKVPFNNFSKEDVSYPGFEVAGCWCSTDLALCHPLAIVQYHNELLTLRRVIGMRYGRIPSLQCKILDPVGIYNNQSYATNVKGSEKEMNNTEALLIVGKRGDIPIITIPNNDLSEGHTIAECKIVQKACKVNEQKQTNKIAKMVGKETVNNNINNKAVTIPGNQPEYHQG
ncbi:hypothetical protein GIB67_024212, partial [Kingdonia uniflora]